MSCRLKELPLTHSLALKARTGRSEVSKLIAVSGATLGAIAEFIGAPVGGNACVDGLVGVELCTRSSTELSAGLDGIDGV